MTADEATPIIIGVGDIKNKSQTVADAVEPMQLMLNAINKAIADCGLPKGRSEELKANIDSIDVVRTWTWPYPDLPGLLAQKLGATLRHAYYSPHGGNQPAKLLDDAAKRLSLQQCKVAVVTGGEALASCMGFTFIACV
jgi:hypothetical protein